MSRLGFERSVAAVAATAILCLTLAMTAFLVIPVFGPLGQEFGWSGLALGLSTAGSVAATGAAFPGAVLLIRLTSVRTVTVGGAAACAGVLLLVLPNLAHLWQFVLALLLLGVARAGAGVPCWQESRCRFGWMGATVSLGAATALALFALTPAMGDLVYRNDWREGCAAAGGAMLLLAAPIAYVLLPGRNAGAGAASNNC